MTGREVGFILSESVLDAGDVYDEPRRIARRNTKIAVLLWLSAFLIPAAGVMSFAFLAALFPDALLAVPIGLAVVAVADPAG